MKSKRQRWPRPGDYVQTYWGVSKALKVAVIHRGVRLLILDHFPSTEWHIRREPTTSGLSYRILSPEEVVIYQLTGECPDAGD